MSLAQRRILVADDNPVNRIVILYELEKLGCRAKAANNGLEAVSAANGERYDLILMDCRMPEMDGYRATAEIRRQQNGRHRIPIVAVTAYDPEESRDKCLAAGMDDYLGKPFRPAELQTILERWLLDASRADSSPIDLAILSDVTNNDAEDMQYLAGIYLENSRASLAKIAAAIASQDAEALQHSAHGCAGSSASFGASRLAELLRELEAMGRERRLADAPSKHLEAQRELERVVTYLDKLFRSPSLFSA
jgi:CheY-like chemotaxis protein